MSAARMLTDGDYKRLKAATRQLVRACGGQESAASITRVDHSQLSRAGNPNEPQFASIDVIADLERDAGDAPVTRELARLAGLAAVALPPLSGPPPGGWAGRLGQLAKESGDVLSKLGQSLAHDGAVSAGESRRLGLRDAIAEAQRVLASLDAALARIEEGA